MFNYKKINSQLLGLTLLTTVGFYNINEASAKPTNTSNTASIVNYSSIIEKLDSKINNRDLKLNLLLEKPKKPSNSADFIDYYLLLAFDNFKEESRLYFDVISSKRVNDGQKKSQIKTVKIVILSLFLILFVLLGIFYPFFLFYKKLLNFNRDYDARTDESIPLNDVSESKPSIASFDSQSLKSAESRNNIQGVVSKLQIAFAVQNDSLRQKLLELCSSIDSRTDRGIVELMRKTVSLAIDRDEWTHLDCSSQSLTVDLMKAEFEAIYTTERSRSTSQKLSQDRGDRSSNLSSENLVRYIVVTLILCTSHTEPLFQDIRTKKQLREKLSELGKMHQDELIKFDLLWNPQEEGQYLSNSELLTKYIDMMRLF